jgi:hypothetical protein
VSIDENRPVRSRPRPNPAGLGRTVTRVSGAPECSMVLQGICLAPAGADRGAVLRVDTTGPASTYYLCHACAAAGGDLRR